MIGYPSPRTSAHAFTLSLVDGRGQVKYQSPELAADVGSGGSAPAGASWFELLQENQADEIRQQFAALVASGRERARWITRVRAGSGAWRSVEVSARNLLSDPTVQSVLLSFRAVPE